MDGNAHGRAAAPEERATRRIHDASVPGGWFVISDFPPPETDDDLLVRHGFPDLGSAELTPEGGGNMQATTGQKRTTATTALFTVILSACANADTGTEVADADAAGAASDQQNGDGEDGGNDDENVGAGDGEAPEPPAAPEPVIQRAEFTDDVGLLIRGDVDGRDEGYVNLMDDASRFVVTEFVIEPGQTFPWHTHPGPVLINIAEADEACEVVTPGHGDGH